MDVHNLDGNPARLLLRVNLSEASHLWNRKDWTRWEWCVWTYAGACANAKRRAHSDACGADRM